MVARIGSYRSGDQLELANGAYVLTGVDAAGMTATSTVTMALGARPRCHAHLRRDTRCRCRNAGCLYQSALRCPHFGHWPALQSGGAIVRPPGSSASRSQRPASNGGPDARFLCRQCGNAPPRTPYLCVSTPASTVCQWISWSPPGIFEAETSGRPGTFELRDASGATLFTFIGTQVRHSIVDGTYELLFRRDGASNSQRFTVAAGERTTLRPF